MMDLNISFFFSPLDFMLFLNVVVFYQWERDKKKEITLLGDTKAVEKGRTVPLYTWW
jgi:hypothetical protein